MNITNKNFTNKEHYLSFRKAWATAVNSENAKTTFIPRDEWKTPHGVPAYSKLAERLPDHGKQPIAGWVQAEHHVLYNVLRDKPITTGFAKLTNVKKIANGAYAYGRLFNTQFQLTHMISTARECIRNTPEVIHQHAERLHEREKSVRVGGRVLSFVLARPIITVDEFISRLTDTNTKQRARVEKFLEPFAGTVTLEMLANVPDIDFSVATKRASV